MKYLTLIFLLIQTLLANSLQEVDTSFSKDVQSKLLKELNSEHSSSLHKQNSYKLVKGWNQLTTPKDGIDVIKTFENISTVKFVVTYDSESKYWAGFTLDQTILKDLKKMLLLKYLEPNVIFFVLATEKTSVDVKYNFMNKRCSNILLSGRYHALYDSGLTTENKKESNADMIFSSRYHSHEYRGFYDDTRVALFYPKLKTTSKATLKYGPAEPTVMFHYAKEYAQKKFFVYDFLEKNCYEGTFPSRKYPPLPVLTKLK